ncbi:uncharacterized protein BJ171DRAFT_410994, partial [Polychytrium aggregatum]|uniref:uncharacterized protein n=1 Tax=Polychytrium aggregatum TaxID=110093 RepID=UPI0022FE0483
KRIAQNRAAQRAFRERKERYVQDLLSRIQELEAAVSYTQQIVQPEQLTRFSSLVRENEALKDRIESLERENCSLR